MDISSFAINFVYFGGLFLLLSVVIPAVISAISPEGGGGCLVLVHLIINPFILVPFIYDRMPPEAQEAARGAAHFVLVKAPLVLAVAAFIIAILILILRIFRVRIAKEIDLEWVFTFLGASLVVLFATWLLHELLTGDYPFGKYILSFALSLIFTGGIVSVVLLFTLKRETLFLLPVYGILITGLCLCMQSFWISGDQCLYDDACKYMRQNPNTQSLVVQEPNAKPLVRDNEDGEILVKGNDKNCYAGGGYNRPISALQLAEYSFKGKKSFYYNNILKYNAFRKQNLEVAKCFGIIVVDHPKNLDKVIVLAPAKDELFTKEYVKKIVKQEHGNVLNAEPNRFYNLLLPTGTGHTRLGVHARFGGLHFKKKWRQAFAQAGENDFYIRGVEMGIEVSALYTNPADFSQGFLKVINDSQKLEKKIKDTAGRVINCTGNGNCLVSLSRTFMGFSTNIKDLQLPL